MRSKNPVFNNNPAFNGQGSGQAPYGGYAQQAPYAQAPYGTSELDEMYNRPSASSVDMGRMTLDDVIMRTAAMFAVLLTTAAIGWVAVGTTSIPLWVGMIGGLILGLVISFKQSTNPALILTYAALEGLFVGGISRSLGAYAAGPAGDGPNIVLQAVIGTLAAFAAMLFLYKTGVIRATGRFKKVMAVALVGYALVAVASLVYRLIAGPDAAFGFYGMGGPGLLLCVAGVALASLTLILDFDFIESGIQNGVPQRFAWLAAFGLVVTLVWLYIEMLRLLAILSGRD